MNHTTALHALHIALGAKMGAFAGYDMPLYYGEGVIKEHEWVRTQCGLFDVSHMGQLLSEGPQTAKFWETLTPSAFQSKAHGRAQYTVLTNETGGIIDDLIITRLTDDTFFTVINAGCKDKDIAWITSQLSDGLRLTVLDQQALIALQGPKAQSVLEQTLKLTLCDMPYMHMIEAHSPCGTPLFISRLGYTGEDGFEISVPNEKAEMLARLFLDHPSVKPIGLAARDSLRLEMGYPLYGHDIDSETSPIEADLAWVMSSSNTGFIGAKGVLGQKNTGPAKKRIGLKLCDKGIAREGAEIRDGSDRIVGALTSGGFSPTLKESIGMGYIETALANIGTSVFVHVRGRNIPAILCALPFVPARTKSMKKKAAA